MPILSNPRHEAFAQARAKGALLEDAYQDAGFVPGHGHASRLALKSEVAARIAEIRAEDQDVSAATGRGLLAALLRVARAAEALDTAAGVREARLTLMEIETLRLRIAMESNNDRRLMLDELKYKEKPWRRPDDLPVHRPRRWPKTANPCPRDAR